MQVAERQHCAACAERALLPVGFVELQASGQEFLRLRSGQVRSTQTYRETVFESCWKNSCYGVTSREGTEER
jgi:hypothetical protein